jgi:ABC-type branched-subunit amino acid transport system substrate-binding protein
MKPYSRRALARGCARPDLLGVVGHFNSDVTITASTVYHECGLAMITPIASNLAVTDRSLANVFRLTNRDDYTGPAIATYLYRLYAVNSYDAGRLLLLAIEHAAKAKGAIPSRADVVAAMRSLRFQGIAYRRPVAWDAKGDNTAAVTMLNVVEDDHFREIAEIGRDDLVR